MQYRLSEASLPSHRGHVPAKGKGAVISHDSTTTRLHDSKRPHVTRHVTDLAPLVELRAEGSQRSRRRTPLHRRFSGTPPGFVGREKGLGPCLSKRNTHTGQNWDALALWLTCRVRRGVSSNLRGKQFPTDSAGCSNQKIALAPKDTTKIQPGTQSTCALSAPSGAAYWKVGAIGEAWFKKTFSENKATHLERIYERYVI